MKRAHWRFVLRGATLMHTSIDRRSFLITAAALTLPGQGQAGPETQKASPELSAYSYGGRVWVRIAQDVFTCYRATASQKYPYFYPLIGPATGLPMTEEAGDPYPHHRSCFLACDHVNEANFWQDTVERGQIVSTGVEVESQADRVVIKNRCQWRQPGNPAILEDRRRFTITAPSASIRIIDADITLKALSDIRISKTNHSLFAIRAARRLTPTGGGRLMNSEGQTGQKATSGQVARWCGFQGTRGGRTESIVLIDHPANPWSPCRWSTRDYGFISPTPMQWLDESGWRLVEGRSVRLRYRIAALATALEDTAIEALYKSFTKA
jgi:hypothetical protein